tara:strand:+ start:1284 stop:1475 length:192 start_codon:yes stop_codon:yes gene_type:complete
MHLIRTLLGSKKFIAALGSGLFVLLNEVLALGITEETINQLIGLAVAYVLGQGIADFGKEAKS